MSKLRSSQLETELPSNVNAMLAGRMRTSIQMSHPEKPYPGGAEGG